MAKPILPVERLPRKRTGSRSSTVGPAVTTTRRRPRSRGITRPSTAAAMALGSAMRPTPESPEATSPSTGPTNSTRPCSRSMATFRCTAGCDHIFGCMAGAARTGQLAQRQRAVTRSSARPPAVRASRSAVAGTRTMASACLARSTWTSPGELGSNISSLTFSPVSPLSVIAPRNSCADRVMTGMTRAPPLRSNLATSAAL